MDAGRSSSKQRSKIGSSGEELALGGARGEKVIKKLVGSGDFNDAGKRSKDRWISKIEIGRSAVIGKGFIIAALPVVSGVEDESPFGAELPGDLASPLLTAKRIGQRATTQCKR